MDDVTVIRTKRRTMAIAVQPTGRVEVRVPEMTPEALVQEKLHKRRHWILKQKRYFAGLNAAHPDRRYLSGESHRYLGRNYRLKISSSSIDEVKLSGGYFRISTTDRTSVNVQRLLTGWFKNKALNYFRKRALWAAKRLKMERLELRNIRIKRMQYRWGSCTPKGVIYLNLDLIRAPSICVDYVIIHELIHLRVPNHGKRFYLALDKFLPNWRLLKKRLENEPF